MISRPSSITCQPMPHAPSVGDSQLSSSNRMSCCRGSMPQASRLCEVDLLHLVGRRLQDHLELVVLEQAVRVLAEPAVVGPPRRLDVGDVPVARAEHAQERLGVRRAGADLEVERLLDEAAARGPELRELEDEVLERHASIAACLAQARRVDFSSFSRCVRHQRAVHRLQLAVDARGERQLARRCCGRDRSAAPLRNAIAPPRQLGAAILRGAPAGAAAHGRHVRTALAGLPETRRPLPIVQRAPAAVARHVRRVHALQPQQPVLEVPRQAVDGHARGQRLDRRGAEPVQPLVRVALRRPLVDQFGEVPDVAQRAGSAAAAAASTRLGVVQAAPARAAPSRSTRRRPASAARARPRTATAAAAPRCATPRFLPRSRVRKTTIRSASPSL